jgi:signal peptidase I
MGVGMDDVAHHRVGPFLITRTFLVEAFRIPTGSMESTLQVGDFLLVNKAVYGARIPFARAQTRAVVAPECGDVVAFPPHHEPAGNNVKRLIGIPGATLEMSHIVRFLNRHAWSEGQVRFGDPVVVNSSAWHASPRPRVPAPTRGGPPATTGSRSSHSRQTSSSDTHSIPCPDALRDGSPVSGRAAPAMPCSDVSGLPEGIHLDDVAVEA